MKNTLRQKSSGQGRPLLWISAAFSLAALISALFFPWKTFAGVIICAIIGLLAAILMVIFPRIRRPIVLSPFILGAIFSAVFIYTKYIPAEKLAGKTADIQFLLERSAQGYGGYGSARGKIVAVNGEKVSINAVLYLEDGSPDFEPGEVLHLLAKISLADKSVRGGLAANGIFVKASQKGEITGITHKKTLKVLGALTAEKIGRQIFKLLDGDEAGVLTALLTGDRSKYSSEMTGALINSGTSHITAVSGMHVSILLSFFVIIFGRKWGLFASVPFIFAYAALAGFTPSVMRASIMCLVFVVSFALKKEGDTLTSLFTALLLLVAVNPLSILSSSLLLSFTSTLGILIFSPEMLAFLRKKVKIKNKLLGKPFDYLLQGITSSVGATVLTLPLCIVFFPRVSLISGAVTVAILWAVSFAMILGAVILLISLASLGAAGFLAKITVYPLLKYVVTVVKWAGAQRWVASADNAYLILAAGAILAELFLFKGKKVTGLGALAIALSGIICFAGLTAFENAMYVDLIIHGEGGDAEMLLRKGDKVVAVSTGGIGRGSGAAFIDESLKNWGITAVDALYMTSGAARAQIGGEAIIQTADVKTAFFPAKTNVTAEKTQILCYNNSGVVAEEGYVIELYYADEETFATRIIIGGTSILNLCRIDPLLACLMFENGPKSDIIIAGPSFADKSKSGAKLCTIVNARAIFICDDGYISPSALEKEWNGEVYLTSKTGDIHLKTLIGKGN